MIVAFLKWAGLTVVLMIVGVLAIWAVVALGMRWPEETMVGCIVVVAGVMAASILARR